MKKLLYILLISISIPVFSQLEESDFDIFLDVDFEDNSLGSYWTHTAEWEADWNETWYEWDGAYDRVYIIDKDGNQCMEINWDLGEHSGVDFFTRMDGMDADSIEYYLSYDVMWKPGFDFAISGKTGGRMTVGRDWSATAPWWDYYGHSGGPYFHEGGRFGTMWWDQGSSTANLGYYFYYHGHDETYGRPQSWGYETLMTTTPEKWYNITVRMVLNTVDPDWETDTTARGNIDGFAEAYFNGEFVELWDTLRMRNVDTIGINLLNIYAYFGGSGSEFLPTRDEWLLTDNYKVWTYKPDLENYPHRYEKSDPGRTIDIPESWSNATLVYNSPTSTNQNNINSCLAWYPFNGNLNDSTGNYDLTQAGSGTTYSTGVMVHQGQAIDLTDANDYFTASNVPMPDTGAISAWVYLTSDNNAENEIMTIGNLTDNIRFYSDMSGTDNDYDFASNISGVANTAYTTSGQASVSTLTHVFVNWIGGTATFYVDNTEVTNDVTYGDGFVTSGTLIIGEYHTGTDHIVGHLDDIRLYDFNLSTSQIDSLYNGYSPALPNPEVYAGPDVSVYTNQTYTLNQSTESNTDSLVWRTEGTGSFSDSTILAPIYSPSPVDTVASAVDLIIVGYGNSTTDSDTMTLSFISLSEGTLPIEDTLFALDVEVSNYFNGAFLQEVVSGVDTTYAMGYLDNLSGFFWANVDFGSGANKVNKRILAHPSFLQPFVMIIDSIDGDTILEWTPESTGDWYTFEEQVSTLSSTVTGVHDVYVQSLGLASGNIHWFLFYYEEPESPSSEEKAVIYNNKAIIFNNKIVAL